VMLGVYTIAAGPHTWAIVFGATYTSNIANVVEPSSIPSSLGHLWSLAQEEQFYILWPLLLLVILRSRPQLLMRMLGALVVFVFVEKLALLGSGAELERIYFAPDTHADPILIGCLFGCMFANGTVAFASDRAQKVIAPLTLVALGASILLPPGMSPFKAMSPLRTLFAVLCGLVILAAVNDGLVTRLLALGPFVFVGRISYSLYLWHVPVFAAAASTRYGDIPGSSVVATALAMMAATLSFYVVEQPLRHRWSQAWPHQPALAPAAVPAP
jgi:peptidoglycan/LPS O-acetylase OafA/YrhL